MVELQLFINKKRQSQITRVQGCPLVVKLQIFIKTSRYFDNYFTFYKYLYKSSFWYYGNLKLVFDKYSRSSRKVKNFLLIRAFG